MSHTLGVSNLGVWRMALMAYLLWFIDGFSYQSVVVWSSILDPAMGAMSEQEVDQRKEMYRSQILLGVNGFNVKSELSRGSGGDRATGCSNTYSGLDITSLLYGSVWDIQHKNYMKKIIF